MAEAARMVEDLGYDAVDINLGCPAKKVVKCGGSGLLRESSAARAKSSNAVRAAVKIPLTIKLRAGWDENSIVAVEVVKMAESVGVEAVAVHPRTRLQGYAGAADWSPHRGREARRENSRHWQWRHHSAGRRRAHGPRNRLRRRHDRPRCRHESLDLFPDAAICRETGRYDAPTEDDRHRLLSGYYGQIRAANLPDGMGKMKQFACWFTHGVGNGSELRRIVHSARTPGEVVENVENFFARKTADGGHPAHEPDDRERRETEVRT